MKKILIKWITKTATRELKDAFDRNFINTEKELIYELMTRIEVKSKDGCGKDIIKIIKNALN